VLIPRVIPLLLVDDESMVKTVRYREQTYLGDPVNVVNLFNRFEVDEIVLLDIGATSSNRGPDMALLEALAEECWVPLAYGGGIRGLDQAASILRLGIEKVVLGTVAADDAGFVRSVSERFGAQAVVVSVDAVRSRDGYEVVVGNARRRLGVSPEAYATAMQDAGAGELLVNAVDRDGTWEGYDLDLVRRVSNVVGIPVIACGGASSRQDLARPIREAGAAAVAAGSLFVFGGPGRGVLVNFPERAVLEGMFDTLPMGRTGDARVPESLMYPRPRPTVRDHTA
jgi:cyclase